VVGIHALLPRVLGRALVACVVLIGLFFMHGLPDVNCAGKSDGGASSTTCASMGANACVDTACVDTACVDVVPVDGADVLSARAARRGC
jgi:hypothetical protein